MLLNLVRIERTKQIRVCFHGIGVRYSGGNSAANSSARAARYRRVVTRRPWWLVAPVLLAGGLAVLWWWRTRPTPHERWLARPSLPVRVQVANYTVPFESYQEHASVIWLLDHLRVPPPPPRAVPAPFGSRWRLRDYLGYFPHARATPRRIGAADLSATDVLYISDTYGVYAYDLAHIPERRVHNDFSELVFGGLDAGDADALERLVARGGHLVSEFNTTQSPTPAPVRARVEHLQGVRWTRWSGRCFANLADEGDLPAWLPREYATQHGRPLPRGAGLVVVDEGGRIEVFADPDIDRIAPRIELPDATARRFPGARAQPFYGWFAMFEVDPSTTASTNVLASLRLPARDDVAAWLTASHQQPVVPFLVERGPALTFAGDVTDIEVELGDYDRADALTRRGGLRRRPRPPSGYGSYWDFMVPVVAGYLREVAAEVRSRRR